MSKKIAIIGAGAAGLAAAKAVQEEGLEFDVFEQNDDIGGVWSKDGSAWEKMVTNISSDTTYFSDLPGDKGAPAFLDKEGMQNYLIKYAKQNNLYENIHFKSKVVHVQKINDKWVVTWKDSKGLHKNSYDAVMIATGRYAIPVIPKIPGLETFKGEVIHSSQYCSRNDFADQKVLIVGSSISGVAIAEDLADVTKQIDQLERRNRWILPKYIPVNPNDKNSPKLPYDLLKSRGQRKRSEKETYEYYSQLCGAQNEVPELRMDPDTPFALAIGDRYVDQVKQGKIKLFKTEISSINQDEVLLQNGQIVKPDKIIFCTGYTPDISYLDQEIQQKLQPNLNRVPAFYLYKDLIHPDLIGICFICMTFQGRAAIFPSAELQSRLAAGYASGRLVMPSVFEMRNCIEHDDPKPDGLVFHDDLAELAKVFPDLTLLKKQNPRLYQLLMEGPTIAAHYRLVGFANTKELAMEMIEKAAQRKEELIKKKEFRNLKFFKQPNSHAEQQYEELKMKIKAKL